MELSDGSRLGGWSVDQMDGQSEGLPPPRAQPTTASDADDFAHRMMENLYYRKLKATHRTQPQPSCGSMEPPPQTGQGGGVAFTPTGSQSGDVEPRQCSRSRSPRRSSEYRRSSRSREREYQRETRYGEHRERDVGDKERRHHRHHRSRSRSCSPRSDGGKRRKRHRRRHWSPSPSRSCDRHAHRDDRDSRGRRAHRNDQDSRQRGWSYDRRPRDPSPNPHPRERDGRGRSGRHAEESVGSRQSPPQPSPARIPTQWNASAAAGTARHCAGGEPLKMVVKESNGEISASIEETNRVRASLGLKPLAGTSTAPALAPAGTGTTSSAINSSVGPQLPSTGGGPASETRDMSKGHTRGGTSRPKLDEARAAAEVRAISLKRYTKARPVWK